MRVTIHDDNIKRVWIGDPCYVIDGELWERAVDLMGVDGKNVKVEFASGDFKYLNDREYSEKLTEKKDKGAFTGFLFSGTGGDGEYGSMSGGMFPVDSGTLAVVPDYLMKENKSGNDIGFDLGEYHDVEYGMGILTDGKGGIRFEDAEGNILDEIYTGNKFKMEIKEEIESLDLLDFKKVKYGKELLMEGFGNIYIDKSKIKMPCTFRGKKCHSFIENDREKKEARVYIFKKDFNDKSLQIFLKQYKQEERKREREIINEVNRKTAKRGR